jgi:methionyl aminopeptidase
VGQQLYYKTNEEIELIRESSLLVSKTHAEVAKAIQPGIATMELDRIAEEFIRDNGGVPAFKGYNGFPSTLCISTNEQVVHGFPGKYELKDGDIISVDCGVVKNGYYGDSAYTFAVGEVKPEVLSLLRVTKECLYKGIEMAVAGKRLGDLSEAIQEHAEKNGYSVVRELVGHGVGKYLHEAPEVPNYGKKGSGIKLQEGLVIAIEPMINMGKKNIRQESDGWTITTADKKPSAHFEHTVAVRAGKADVLSTFEYIEEVLKKQGVAVL